MDNKYKHLQSIDGITTGKAEFVRFSLNGGWDYVFVTYVQKIGFITITSSYGNWSYIWSAMGKGTLLSEFFLQADADYLSNKLMDDQERTYFDSDQAIKDIKKRIIQERKDEIIGKTEARDLVNALKELKEDFNSNYENDRNRFLDAFSENDTLYNWFPEFYEPSWGLKATGSYNALKYEIIPMIKDHFKTLEVDNGIQSV